MLFDSTQVSVTVLKDKATEGSKGDNGRSLLLIWMLTRSTLGKILLS